jgi:hypothetical protein
MSQFGSKATDWEVAAVDSGKHGPDAMRSRDNSSDHFIGSADWLFDID